MPKRVHRELRLTSPLTNGDDIKVLQRALNQIAEQFPRILDFKLRVDGELGPRTLDGTLRAAHVMGVARPRLNQIEKRRVVIKRVQRVLRTPKIRSDTERERSRRRIAELREQLSQGVGLANLALDPAAGARHWGGSNDVMTGFVEPLMVQRGLPLGSGKRTPAQNTAVGGSPTSDHLTTKTTTAARDFPTFAGEDDARALARAMGFSAWRPNAFDKFTVSAGGRRFLVQILWGAQIDHDDHVHVGISRV